MDFLNSAYYGTSGDQQLTILGTKILNESVSPGGQSWTTDNSELSESRRPNSRSPPLGGFDRSPPHPPISSPLQKSRIPVIRQRTAQACEKCRERKTKCSGHHPVCGRCTNRGLICRYSTRETRMRLPMKSRGPLPDISRQKAQQAQLEYLAQTLPAMNAFVRSSENFAPMSAPSPYIATPICGIYAAQEDYQHSGQVNHTLRYSDPNMLLAGSLKKIDPGLAFNDGYIMQEPLFRPLGDQLFGLSASFKMHGVAYHDYNFELSRFRPQFPMSAPAAELDHEFGSPSSDTCGYWDNGTFSGLAEVACPAPITPIGTGSSLYCI